MTKKEARQLFKSQIKLITNEEKNKRTNELINLISNLEEFKKATKIAIYYPLKYEMNLTKLIELFPMKKFYFPKVVKDSLNFYLITNLEELKPSLFGLKEPLESVNLERDIEVYLVPCLASSNNYRIGHGAGFYDKYFAKYNGFKVGITYHEFKDLDVDYNDHDIPMDVIL